MSRAATTIAFVVLALSQASCSRTIRMYEGPARSKAEVALIVRAPESHAQLRSVDGKSWSVWVRQFELLPGSHGVLVGFEKRIVTYGYNVTYIRRSYSPEDVQVGFRAEPGHRYTVYTEVGKPNDVKLQRSHTLPDSWYEALPVGKDIGQWRVVVCDLDTGQVVSQTDAVLLGARGEASARGQNAELLRGVALWERDQRQDALTVFTHVTETDPGNAQAWYMRGLAFAHLGRLEDARTSFERAVTLDPSREYCWYDRGVVLDRLGSRKDALASLDRCLELNPRYQQGWIVKANMLMNMERLEEALQCAKQATKLDSASLEAWVVKGRILRQLNRQDEAEKAFDRAARK
jgi:tetratricopeptide (TPR) repeat protein